MIETPREREQRARERKEFLESLPLMADYAECYGTPAGQRVLIDMIKRYGVLSVTFSNSGWTGFKEGERNVVLRAMSLAPREYLAAMATITADMESEYQTLLAESLKEEQ